MPLDIEIKVDDLIGQQLLEDVKVKTFEATPSSTRPFGETVLEWKVEAPPGVALLLDRTTVPLSGTHTTEPLSTTTFRLSARALTAEKLLGQVTVTVHVGACRETTIPGD